MLAKNNTLKYMGLAAGEKAAPDRELVWLPLLEQNLSLTSFSFHVFLFFYIQFFSHTNQIIRLQSSGNLKLIIKGPLNTSNII